MKTQKKEIKFPKTSNYKEGEMFILIAKKIDKASEHWVASQIDFEKKEVSNTSLVLDAMKEGFEAIRELESKMKNASNKL